MRTETPLSFDMLRNQQRLITRRNSEKGKRLKVKARPSFVVDQMYKLTYVRIYNFGGLF